MSTAGVRNYGDEYGDRIDSRRGVQVTAADLSKIDRSLAKEPSYKDKPGYCLLVFGAAWPVPTAGRKTNGQARHHARSSASTAPHQRFRLAIPPSSDVREIQMPPAEWRSRSKERAGRPQVGGHIRAVRGRVRSGRDRPQGLRPGGTRRSSPAAGLPKLQIGVSRLA